MGSLCPLAPSLCSKQALSDAALNMVMARLVCGMPHVIKGPLLCNHPRNNIFIKSRDIFQCLSEKKGTYLNRVILKKVYRKPQGCNENIANL